MKLYPPRLPRTLPPPRRRIPAFHAVPLAPRADGWTPTRQGHFIGMLAQTRSVAAAARAVSMGRESAYRLRARPGAAGFAAAWDAAMGKPHVAVDLSSAKATGLPASYRHQAGLLQVVMAGRRFLQLRQKPDDSALLQHLAQLDRACAGVVEAEEKSHFLKPEGASAPAVDFRADPLWNFDA